MKGHLFVFEGADGVGKTSIIDLLYVELTKQKFAVKKIGFPGYDEGTLGNLIYQIHNNPERFYIKVINPTSLQLLHIAAHIDSIKRDIIPALKAGTIVLLDRYWWSTYIYGKISGINNDVLKKIIDIEKFYWNSIFPDKLFLIKRLCRPLKFDIEIEKWKYLQIEYNFLSNTEKINYPILEIINENSIETTKNIVREEILKIIH